MIIIPRLKYWLKALELFLIQIPIFLFSLLPSALLTTPFSKNSTASLLVFLCVFVCLSSLFFAYYYDWGKDKPLHGIKFIPSKTGFFEGFAMNKIAFISNFIASIPLKSSTEILYFVILWLYVASYCFHLRYLRQKKRP